MSILNEFVCPNVRFKFWNGNKGYTVECAPSIRTYFIFNEDETENCLAKYELNKNDKSVISMKHAADCLEHYFLQINSENFVTY